MDRPSDADLVRITISLIMAALLAALVRSITRFLIGDFVLNEAQEHRADCREGLHDYVVYLTADAGDLIRCSYCGNAPRGVR